MQSVQMGPRIVDRRLVIEATASQSSTESFWNDDSSRFHPAASIPNGPAAPSVLRAMEWMRGPSILSYNTGWGPCEGTSSTITVEVIG